MTPGTDLFELIKSLSRSEKRYFKLYAIRHIAKEKNEYLSIFERIDKQQEYDEPSLKSDTKHFASKKEYLYRLVLKSLNAFHIEGSVETKLKELIHHANILHSKGLYAQYEKILNKALKIGYQYKKYTTTLEILTKKIELVLEKPAIKGIREKLQELYKERRELPQKLDSTYQYQELYMNIFLSYIEIITGNKEKGIKKLETNIKNPLLEDENKAIGYYSKISFYESYYLYHCAKNNLAEGYRYMAKAINIIERNPLLINDNPSKYIITLYNLAQLLIESRKYDEALQVIERLRKIPTHQQPYIIKIFAISYSLELDIYTKKGGFSKALSLVKNISQKLDQYDEKIDELCRSRLYFRIAYVYFGANQFNDTLDWLDKILYKQKPDLLEGIYALTKILQIITHYELGSDLLVESLIKSTIRLVGQKDTSFQISIVPLLNFINNKLLRTKDTPELKDEIEQIKVKFRKNLKDPYVSDLLEFFDFIGWLDSKIENRPFAQIVANRCQYTNATPSGGHP